MRRAAGAICGVLLSLAEGIQALAADAVPVRAANDTSYLAGVPLSSLTATRDRPLFAPSRRPAPTAATATAPPPPLTARFDEPLRFTLLGIVNDTAGRAFAVVMDDADHTSVSLRPGDARRGWIMQGIDKQAVILQKGSRTTRLTFPNARAGEAAGAPAPGTPAARLPAE